MIKLTLKFLCVSALLFGFIAIAGCGPKTADNAPANNAKKDTPKTDAPAGDTVGVPECDEYIAKYEACLTSIAEKYPQVHPSLKSAFETQRKGFKDAAANPQSKATLASTCKQAIENAKTATSAYACKW